MRLLGDGPIIDTAKNGEKVPKLEIAGNVLVFTIRNYFLLHRKC